MSNTLGRQASLDDEKGDALLDSSSASNQLKSGSDGDQVNERALSAEPTGQVRVVTGFKWFLTASAMLCLTFLYALGQTAIADVQPEIVERFEEIRKLPLLQMAFLLVAVSTNLVWYGNIQIRLGSFQISLIVVHREIGWSLIARQFSAEMRNAY